MMEAVVYDEQVSDIDFLLSEVLKCYGNSPSGVVSGDLDREAALSIIDAAKKFSLEKLSSGSSQADRVGCALDANQRVQIPPSYDEVWRDYCRMGFTRLGAPKTHGGLGVPYVLCQAVNEILVSGDPAFMVYSGFCIPALMLLDRFGDEKLLAWAPQLASGEVTACLCLTEGEAGSDLANVGTRAEVTSSGSYRVRGRKCFISAGMHDLPRNIIYVVLARTSGMPPDSLGLSCIIVPRFRINREGNAVPNGISCRRVDETMGFRGCPTVELEFGAADDCFGHLLGSHEGRGLVQLRSMMADARIATGVFAVGIASAAHGRALAYARERRQGVALGKSPLRRERPEIIARHADVRRMLMEMRSRLEGCRALMYRLAWCRTMELNQCNSESERRPADPMHHEMVQLLTPLLKAYASEQAWRISDISIQVHGGAGYLRSFRVEQCARDSKVLSIWEGTNYIQAIDLVVDKLALGRDSRLLARLLYQVRASVEALSGSDDYGSEVIALRSGVAAVESCHKRLEQWAKSRSLELIEAFATRILDVIAEVVVGWLLLESAVAASRCIERDGVSTSFYRNKIAVARFYFRNILPFAVTRAEIVLRAEAACDAD